MTRAETHDSSHDDSHDDWIRLLANRFDEFAADEGDRIPMYGHICRGAAQDPEVLDLLMAAPEGQRRPVLVLAALHDLVLADPTEPLAAWFPTVASGAPASGDPWPTARRTLLDRRAEFRRTFATRSTQTNEPNRSALWSIVIPWVAADVDAPLALVELGCSAGLNLRWDSYGLEVDGRLVRAPNGRTTVQTSVRTGIAPILPVPDIVARVGIDLAPIELSSLGQCDEREARWLRACVWPEQTARFDRFDHAVADMAAAPSPPGLVAGDALDQLAVAVESMAPEAHVVVMWSWFLIYLYGPRRSELDALLDQLGAVRTLTLISAEASGVHRQFVDPGRDGDDPHEFRTIVGVSRWRGHNERHELRNERHNEVVARCHAHLTWLDWLA